MCRQIVGFADIDSSSDSGGSDEEDSETQVLPPAVLPRHSQAALQLPPEVQEAYDTVAADYVDNDRADYVYDAKPEDMPSEDEDEADYNHISHASTKVRPVLTPLGADVNDTYENSGPESDDEGSYSTFTHKNGQQFPNESIPVHTPASFRMRKNSLLNDVDTSMFLGGGSPAVESEVDDYLIPAKNNTVLPDREEFGFGFGDDSSSRSPGECVSDHFVDDSSDDENDFDPDPIDHYVVPSRPSLERTGAHAPQLSPESTPVAITMHPAYDNPPVSQPRNWDATESAPPKEVKANRPKKCRKPLHFCKSKQC